MADGCHLEKSKNNHISATDCLIGTKFGMNPYQQLKFETSDHHRDDEFI